ncbi:uncharacterized protein LOC105701791 [Orussus abietinus]|uniref:uncharacterized protein LOC105701791 n=1 Tax=Orussus abietinus TaxID=222816 RepID=UPI00062510E2|nr:uncharacterized protein LOC105701791 [Orussus abietinus]
MGVRNALLYLAVGFLILGIFTEEAEARRKILRGRKTITRRYYGGTAIPAWSVVLLSGIGMLALGGGLYLLLKKLVLDGADLGEQHSYQPAGMHDEV